MNVKEEPVSSTNDEHHQQQQQQQHDEAQHDEKPTIAGNSNVTVKQPPANDDFENDPEAGPSGLQNEHSRNRENDNRYFGMYIDSSDTEDSVDEREMSSTLWRPQPAFRFSRIDDDSGDTRDTRYSNQSWRFDQTTMNEPPHSLSDDIPIPLLPIPPLPIPVPTARNVPANDVVDLVDSEITQSVQNPPLNRSHEVLTAPDLQLDWASDTSSDNEIICTIPPQTLESNNLPAIDLTGSDDEEATNSRNTSNESPSLRQPDRVYCEVIPTRRIPHYGSRRSSSYHEEDRNDR